MAQQVGQEGGELINRKKTDGTTDTRQLWSDADIERLLDRVEADVHASEEKQVLLAYSTALKEHQAECDQRLLANVSELVRTFAQQEDQPATFPSLLAQVAHQGPEYKQFVERSFGAETDKLLKLSASLPKIRRSIEHWKRVLVGFLGQLDLDRSALLWVLTLLRRESAMLPQFSAPSLEYSVDGDAIRQPKSELGWGDKLADVVGRELLHD